MTDSTDNKLTYNRILERAMDDAEEAMPDLPKLPELQCFADSARGLYIPQYFAESIDRDEIAQAVEQVKDELIDLSQTAMDNIT